MFLPKSVIRWLLIVVLLSIGCDSKPATTTSKSSDDDDAIAAAANRASNAKKIIPVKRDVTDVIGNWVIVVSNNRIDNYRWIIKFVRGEDGKINGEFIDTTRDTDPDDKPKIDATEISDKHVQFTIKTSKATYDFQGVFEGGFIRGTIQTAPMELVLVRLLPTDETSFEKFSATGFPPGSDVVEAKMKSKEVKPEDLMEVVREYRTSPVAQDLLSMMLTAYVQQKADENKFKELIDEYMTCAKFWGERWEARTEISIAVSLINSRLLSGVAEQHLSSAEKKLGSNLEFMKDSIAGYRDASNANLRILQITNPSSTVELQADAYKDLLELVKKQPYNAEVLHALASHAERIGQKEIAIEYLSDLCSLPLLEASIPCEFRIWAVAGSRQPILPCVASQARWAKMLSWEA